MIHGSHADVRGCSITDDPRKSEDGAITDDPRVLRGGHTDVRGCSVTDDPRKSEDGAAMDDPRMLRGSDSIRTSVGSRMFCGSPRTERSRTTRGCSTEVIRTSVGFPSRMIRVGPSNHGRSTEVIRTSVDVPSRMIRGQSDHGRPVDAPRK